MKRVFDLIVSSVGLLLFSPILLFLCIMIKVSDNGPVFFKHRRVGKNRILFNVLKLRTMRDSRSGIEENFEPGNISRVTSVGKFLRKSKLDEVPQLINVLKGEMSLVGPRPEVEKWVNEHPEKWARILSVRPGMTDNASILYRNEELILAESDDPEMTYKNKILPRKLELYENYVNNISFTGDMKIIFKTIFSVFFK